MGIHWKWVAYWLNSILTHPCSLSFALIATMRFTSIDVNSFQLKSNALFPLFDWLFFGLFASFVRRPKVLLILIWAHTEQILAPEMPILKLSFVNCAQIDLHWTISLRRFPSIFLFSFFDSDLWRTIVLFSKFTIFAKIKMNHGLCDRCGCKHENRRDRNTSKRN